MVATGAEEPGVVRALRLAQVPRQTPLGSIAADAQVLRDARRGLQDAVDAHPSPIGARRAVQDTTVEVVVEPTHDVATGLVDQTMALGADLLVLGWHGGFSLGRIADSPVRRVVAGLPADFAVLKDRGLDELERIVVPWGGGRHARLGLELALRIAAVTDARVELLRAVRSDVDIDKETARVRAETAALVEGTGATCEVLIARTDDVVKAITDAATERDLVVIGASGESGLRTVLFGTIPDIVADRAPCSVLLVRRHVPSHWAYRTSDRLKRLRERTGRGSSAE